MDHQGCLKDFQIQKKLGQGAFGQVFLVKRKVDGKIYALKKVKLAVMKDKQKDNALNQVRILASLDDQYIVKFKQAFFDAPSNCICIVMEYAKNGDLLKMINNHIRQRSRVSQDQIWKILIDILRGLKSLHDKKIIHRDVKSANIFISQDGKYKLGDLNVSKVLKKGLAYTQTGTPYYASPQIWQDVPYDMKTDIWSLGCVIYQMASLQPPFKATDLQGLYKKIKVGYFKPIPPHYSHYLSEIISMMLKVKPRQRVSTDELLRNPIIKKKCSAHIEQTQTDKYHNKQNILLDTIKFNPYNMNSIKYHLPKSSYGEEDQNHCLRLRNNSVQSLNSKKRQRALSACRIRSPSIKLLAPQSYKPLPPPSNTPKPISINRPPKQPKMRQQQQEPSRDRGRLIRAGQEIIGIKQRSSSVRG